MTFPLIHTQLPMRQSRFFKAAPAEPSVFSDQYSKGNRDEFRQE